MQPTPPEAPVTRTGPSPGPEAVVLQPVEGQGGGEPGGADDGRPAGVEAVGQGHHPAGRHPGQLGEPTVVGHPQVVAVDDDLAGRRPTDGSAESSTVPTRSTPGTRGEIRATRLPGRVTMPSL